MSTSSDTSSSAIAAVAIVVLVVIALIAGMVLFTHWNPFVRPGSGEGSTPQPTSALPTIGAPMAAPLSQSTSGGGGFYLQTDS